MTPASDMGEAMHAATPTSLWRMTAPAMQADDFEAEPRDVIVVGAGLTGLTTAVLFARAGLRVTVLEARQIGAVTTGNTTGKLSLLQGSVFSDLSAHGDEVLRAYAQANLEGQAWLLRELASWGVDAPRRTAYTYATGEDQLETLERERDAARAAGIEVEERTDIGLPFAVAGALALDHQAQVQPFEVLNRLLQELRGRGGRVAEACRVRDVQLEGEGVIVHTERGRVNAQLCVLATGTPILDRGMFFAKLEPSRSFVAAYRLPGPAPQGMYVSLGEPNRSMRTASGPEGEELFVVGGGSHVTGRFESTATELADLDVWVHQHFARCQRVTWWAAQDYRSHSRIPFAGAMPNGGSRIFTATGYNKWGMTNAVAAALTIVADALGGHLEWARVLQEHSLAGADVMNAVSSNAATAGRALADWVSLELSQTDRAANAPEALGEGEGVMTREGLRPVGVARVDGKLCRVSGICSHLGGIVNWNEAERSWDCPLHGSRFTATGEVLEGPAVHPLGEAEAEFDVTYTNE